MNFRQQFTYLKGNILVFSITDLLGNFSRRLVFPYVSLYILALDGDARQIGLISALAPLAGLIMFPLGGYIADHANRVRLIVLANGLSILTILMYTLAPTWQMIAFAALFQGLIVVQFPAKSSLIADALAPEERGKGIAAMNTISSTLALLAPYLAGIIVDAYGANIGVRILYAIMMAFYTSSMFVHVYLLEDSSPHAQEKFQFSALPRTLKIAYSGIPELLRQFPHSLRALAVVIVLNFMANGVAGPFWVVYTIQEIGLSPTSWGLILLLESLLKLFLFMPAGLSVDRWGRTPTLLLALLLSLVAIPLYAFATKFITVLILRLIIALAYTLAIPACTALMADTIPRHIRGRVMAAIGQGGIQIGQAGGGTGGPAVGFIITIPLMVSALAGGYLYDLDPMYPWFFVCLTTALSVLITIFFIRDPLVAND